MVSRGSGDASGTSIRNRLLPEIAPKLLWCPVDPTRQAEKIVAYEVDFEWAHIQHQEASAFQETYGFSGSHGSVHLEGIRIRPRGMNSRTLLIFMHPATTLQLLPAPGAAAAAGLHVLCAASRYARNDTALIYEKVLLDLGAWIRHAKEVWGYRHVVLEGWSGGGSLAVFYQSQAEHPSITDTPAGDPVDVVGARLVPADAVIFHAAHLSRARMLQDMIDPSVVDELDPETRRAELDLYDVANPNQPPYSKEFIAGYRQAQLARMRSITSWVKTKLEALRHSPSGDLERGFMVHRTLAEPRFLDPALDPNDRRPGWCYMGKPVVVNNGPVGLARFTTLRSWLSQWSIDDSRCDSLRCGSQVSVPLLVIENTADEVVPQPHCKMLFDAAASSDKTLEVIKGATHYYAGQPDLMDKVTGLMRGWLAERDLLA